MRAQVVEKSRELEQATADVAGALTAEACAMYSAAAGLLRQIDALAVKVMLAEHSHERHALTAHLEALRAQVGRTVDVIYRTACESPRSRFTAVREAQAALAAEVTLFMWPKNAG